MPKTTVNKDSYFLTWENDISDHAHFGRSNLEMLAESQTKFMEHRSKAQVGRCIGSSARPHDSANSRSRRVGITKGAWASGFGLLTQ